MGHAKETGGKRKVDALTTSPDSPSRGSPKKKRGRTDEEGETADDLRRTSRPAVPTKRFDGLEGTRPPLSKGKKSSKDIP